MGTGRSTVSAAIRHHVARFGRLGIALALLSATSLPAAQAETSETSVAAERADAPSPFDRVYMNFYSLYFGPSLERPRVAYQPDPFGNTDYNYPVELKNYFTMGYELSNLVTVSGTAYFSWTPVEATSLTLLDPYLRLAHNSLISSENFNLYADVRWHLPITWLSRQNDLLAGVQFFQVSTYDVPDTRLTLGAYTSERFNLFGPRGFGHDLELYFGPNLSYQVSPTVAITLLYEMAANHDVGGGEGLRIVSPDIEPGISWDITPELNFSPYLNIYTGNGLSLASTSVGFTFGWVIM